MTNTKTVTLILESKRIRNTAVRHDILLILMKSQSPLSHQEILNQKMVKDYDRVTVYRTLDIFTKAKIIHKALGPDGVWRFCANKEISKTQCAGNHLHFFCVACQTMTCLPQYPIPWIDAPKGAEIYGKQLLVYGRCKKCLQKGKKS